MNLDVSSWLQVAILQYGMTVQGSTGTTPGVCPRLPGRPTKANTAAFATHTGFPLPSQAPASCGWCAGWNPMHAGLLVVRASGAGVAAGWRVLINELLLRRL